MKKAIKIFFYDFRRTQKCCDEFVAKHWIGMTVLSIGMATLPFAGAYCVAKIEDAKLSK